MNEERTILVTLAGESMRTFSDIAGRHVVRIGNDAASRNELATRLRRAHCNVNTEGDRWLTTGDFADAVGSPLPGSEESDGGSEDDVSLTEEEQRVLVAVAQGEESNVDRFTDDIARAASVAEKGLVETYGGQMGRGNEWSLTSAGREYLVQNDLL